MTSRELLYIKTIADEKSFTRAAQKLYISQPSLSHCVSNIEEQLGVKLFRRTTSGLLLTFAGEQYYRMAVSVLRMYSDFEADISQINSLSKGRVDFGITATLATEILPKVLPAFSKEHPGIEIRVSEVKAAEMEMNVIAGHLDFAIMHMGPDTRENEDKLQCRLIRRDSFLLATPREQRFLDMASAGDGGLPELDISLIGNEPFMTVNHGQRIRQVSDLVLTRAGIRPKVIYTGRSYETIRRMVAMGMGCTLLPQQYIGILGGEEYQPYYFSIPKKYGASWDLGIVTATGSYLSAASQALLEQFVQILGE